MGKVERTPLPLWSAKRDGPGLADGLIYPYGWINPSDRQTGPQLLYGRRFRGTVADFATDVAKVPLRWEYP
jgi:hypothetical protein